MRFFYALAGFMLWLEYPVFSQEMNLRQYLRELNSAPGVTVKEKVDYLAGVGVSLSPQGRRELQAAGQSLRSRGRGWATGESFGSALSPLSTSGLSSGSSAWPATPFLPRSSRTLIGEAPDTSVLYLESGATGTS